MQEREYRVFKLAVLLVTGMLWVTKASDNIEKEGWSCGSPKRKACHLRFCSGTAGITLKTNLSMLRIKNKGDNNWGLTLLWGTKGIFNKTQTGTKPIHTVTSFSLGIRIDRERNSAATFLQKFRPSFENLVR